MSFLQNYGLFLAKTATLVAAVLLVAAGMFSLAARGRGGSKGHLRLKRLNDRYRDLETAIQNELLGKQDRKKLAKHRKKALKAAAKTERRRVFVLNFHGDIKASAVDNLREEITSVLTVARPADEVVVRLESSGGMVHAYGLAASQLARIRTRDIPLTVTVDKVAASGGYMMACVANRILAAPFAVIGSIGVIGQLPNFNRFLKKHDIDFEQMTAGEYKRTLTLLGENTEKARDKFKAELEDTHALFKDFIRRFRPDLDLTKTATGEHWYGEHARELALVDELKTSDDYLMELSSSADMLEVNYSEKRGLAKRVGLFLESTALRVVSAR